MNTYNHIIIGTGQATGTLLGRLIPTQDSIAVIEGGSVGGSCVNYGCTPTKALVASARAVHVAGMGEEFGFSAGKISVDFARVRERMNGIRFSSRDGLTDWMESTDNVTLLRGWASFESSDTVRVNDELLKGKKIHINTGTRHAVPDIEGLNDVPWMDSERLLDLETLPDHLLIIGGGYVGLEFAQVFRRLGSKVTVVQRGNQLMPNEDEDVAEAIRQILEDEGIAIHCGTSAKSVRKRDSEILLTVASDNKTETLSGSHLLIAAGRRPNSAKLNLDQAGVQVDDRGFIKVDDFCRTNVDGIFALGDVNGKGAFTHTSVNDAEIVLDHLFGGKRKLSDRIPIYGLFTDPPLGRVGLSEKEAREKGIRYMKATRAMAKISRAKEMGEISGFAKLLVDADTDLILGAAILGPGGDEVINMFAAIMHSQIPCREYRKVVLAHPTVAELMPWVLDGLKEVE